MHNRRNETAPAWLVALAAAALGMSWAVTRQWSAPAVRAGADMPNRTTAPLRWPLAELRPLPQAVLPADSLGYAPTLLPSGVSIRIDAPALQPMFQYDLAFAVKSKPHATAPLRLAGSPATDIPETRPVVDSLAGYLNRMVVLVPGAPQWTAGQGGKFVITAGVRHNWSIGAVDTIALARSTGHAIASPRQTLRPAVYAARVGLFGEPQLSPLRPSETTIAAAAPQLVGPVRPEGTRRATLAQPTPTIAAYLNRAELGGAFPIPVALADQLDRVATSPQNAPWSWAVAYRLRTLAGTRVDDLSAHRTLRTLADAADEAFVQADKLGDSPAATELRRAGYALTRRLDTWRAEQALTIASMDRLQEDRLAGARWAMSLNGLGLSPGAMLHEVERHQAEHGRLAVARRVEEYESQPSARLAQLLAMDATRLVAEPDAESQAVAEAIESSYRNANIRVAIAGDFIKRMLPQPEAFTAPINDRIAGNPVSGQSTTQTDLAIQLIEDPSAWRIGLEARGVVQSQTYSRGGPAVVGARGETSFVAKKLVVLTGAGLQAAPSIAEAQTQSQRLVSMSTSYDRVPLVRSYVRSAVRNEYDRASSRARSEVKGKIEKQVCRTLDERVTPQLFDAQQRFTAEVIDRVESLGLEIEPIELRTTEDRLISRIRLANSGQLAAHTPRMRAPSDSLISVQVHESTFNNALDGLGLAGATMTPVQLRERIDAKLRLPNREQAPAEEAVFRFAAEDPVRFELAEGRAHLTLAFDDIVVRGRRHSDFKVHVFYKPEVNGLTAELVQDGPPAIEGKMRNASRMHLHGVMGKVLGENRRVPLVRVNEQTPERFSKAMVGMATNQLVIEDGWLGLAIGPERQASRVAIQVGGYVR